MSFGDENVQKDEKSIASCERSFSKLKLIITYLRTTTDQKRLNDLAKISVEGKSNEPTDFHL